MIGPILDEIFDEVFAVFFIAPFYCPIFIVFVEFDEILQTYLSIDWAALGCFIPVKVGKI